jgi:hypothetical protein
MSNQNHWSGKKSITSFEQNNQPSNPRQGDLWIDTDDYTGQNRTEIYTSSWDNQ